eukprot:g12776.t1
MYMLPQHARWIGPIKKKKKTVPPSPLQSGPATDSTSSRPPTDSTSSRSSGGSNANSSGGSNANSSGSSNSQ